MLSSLYAGRRIMYLPTFDAAEWVAPGGEERITHAMVVPTMLGRILQAVEEAGVEPPALRHLSYGGGRMPLELVERTLRDMPHVDLVNAYGLTETSSTIAMLTPDEHREAYASDDPAVRARLGSVGRPLPSLEVEVRGEDEVAVPSARRARSGCAASRWPASTWGTTSSPRTAGSAPGTPAGSTSTASSTSTAGSTT